jgi:hypothetical protein
VGRQTAAHGRLMLTVLGGLAEFEEWDHSRLEGILEFFEKLASLFKLSADMPFICESTLGWYAVRYFLFARAHCQIEYLRNLWQDDLYQDLEDFLRLLPKRRSSPHPKDAASLGGADPHHRGQILGTRTQRLTTDRRVKDSARLIRVR